MDLQKEIQIEIRIARKEDINAIVSIYNEAVKAKFMTADTDPWKVEEKQAWLQEHTENEFPVYVAVLNNEVVGWLSVSPYRKGRMALRFIKEVSYYITGKYRGYGIGSRLMQFVIDKAPALQVKNYIAILLDVNTASIKLLEKFGFQKWGHLPAIADFDGTVCGHLYYGLAL